MRSSRPAFARRSTCEYVARHPNPSACPNGSIPATSTRSSQRNASMLLTPGPRALPPRPLTTTTHHAPSPASTVLCGLFVPRCVPVSCPLLSWSCSSLSVLCSAFLSLDHFVRPLIPDLDVFQGLD